jgi:hypothetical protein
VINFARADFGSSLELREFALGSRFRLRLTARKSMSTLYSGCGVHHRLSTASPWENGVDSAHDRVYFSYGLRVSTRHARKP